MQSHSERELNADLDYAENLPAGKDRESRTWFSFPHRRRLSPTTPQLVFTMDPQAARGNGNTGCVFLMQNIRFSLTEGKSLCIRTKPNYLPIVHLKDGESRVLCQLLFLFFRRVRVLKEDKKDRCMHTYFGREGNAYHVPGAMAGTRDSIINKYVL